MTGAAWWNGRLAAFDVETTGVDVEEARIVTAVVALVGGGEPPVAHSWLADPGVEIPEGAAEVHGITTEIARRDGRPAPEVIGELVDVLATRSPGVPIVAFNARFDLTIADREARRRGITPLAERPGELLVIDPLVIDKHLDRYRKGSRKLDAICATYGARLDGAHDAENDAIAAARAAWVLGAKGQVIRKVWNAEMGREKAALTREWERVRGDLRLLHDAQVRWAHDQAISLAEYFREKGQVEDAAGVKPQWPMVTAEAATA